MSKPLGTLFPPSRRSIDSLARILNTETVKIVGVSIRLNSGQPRARVDRSDIETSIGFEHQFRAVLCKFPIAIQKDWAQQKTIGKFPARCETVSCPKIRTIPRSTIRFVHSVCGNWSAWSCWVEHETLGQDPRTS